MGFNSFLLKLGVTPAFAPTFGFYPSVVFEVTGFFLWTLNLLPTYADRPRALSDYFTRMPAPQKRTSFITVSSDLVQCFVEVCVEWFWYHEVLRMTHPCLKLFSSWDGSPTPFLTVGQHHSKAFFYFLNFPQFYWELINIQHYISLRYTA